MPVLTASDPAAAAVVERARDARLRFWQGVTLVTLLTGYTGYYLCRSNLSVAAPLMLEALGPSGFDRRAFGLIASAGVFCYAAGKFATGVAGDFIGGRTMFLAGMAGSVLATLLFGASTSVVLFAVVWGANRLLQSAGWGGLVKVASHWFSARSYGAVMAALSLSYLFGDAACRLLLGRFIAHGAGWREVFFGSGAILGILTAVAFWTLKASPAALALPEPDVNPRNVYGAAGAGSVPASLRDLLTPFARDRAFWLVCGVSFALTLIREALNVWIPLYLVDVHHQTHGAAAQLSSLFPLAGGVSTLISGALSDRVPNRLSLTWPLLVLATCALAFLASPAASASTGASLLAIVLVALSLLGPYSLLAGAIALDFGGRRGSATAAGLIDSAGYVGAVFSGYAIGAVADRAGWPLVFLALAAVCLAAVMAVVGYGRMHAVTTRVGTVAT
jgi:OPA family glycerol-3-phosphate transporter-like MFS transporter